MKALAASIHHRASGQEPRDRFDLYLFDEVDSTMSQFKQAPGLIKLAIKQANHQNLGLICIGQNANASNYRGFDRSDWNNAVNLHIGANAYDAITNTNALTSSEQNDLKTKADKLTEFCASRNRELGLDAGDPDAYRFAFVVEPSKKPYFIELPAFGRYTYDLVETASDASNRQPAAASRASNGSQPGLNADSSVASTSHRAAAHSAASTPYLGDRCPKCEAGTLIRTKRNRGTLLYICDTCQRSTAETVLSAAELQGDPS